MSLIHLIASHGYLSIAVVLFLAAAGLPLPTSVVLLTAGATAHAGGMSMALVLLVAWAAAFSGDMLLFLGGRYTGWWLLALMCRLSVNPESCIFTGAEYFYRRGPGTLLFAKFIPGLGAMAAPLAGSLNMRPGRFWRLDAMGNLGYCATWIGIGFLFSGFIVKIVHTVEQAGHVVALFLLVVVLVYAVVMLGFAIGARRYRRIQKISAAGLKERIEELTPNKLVIIADVRSHGYYDPGMQRIANSIRVEPHRLKEEILALREFMAPECEIYLYCSCIRDTTSLRVAHMLEQASCEATVIEGGIKAWIKAGGALEGIPASDLEKLPRFE